MSKLVSTLIRSLPIAFALALLLCFADAALGCPTCKENLANDPEAANIVRGYFYSILFMLSMPPLIFGSLCAYFYWEVRKAKMRAAKVSAETGAITAPQS